MMMQDALNETDSQRINSIKPLIPPQILVEDLPLSLKASQTVKQARMEMESCIKGTDDRLIVIVGPCSIHDPKSAVEYCRLLADIMPSLQSELLIVMRVYFEKPRTTVGWKGLINDPELDGSFAINKGLRIARGLLLEISEMGMPAAVEFLDTISPQYFGDLVSWGAIGARTTESQVHRELASGLSCPVGFKNGTMGNIDIAIDAIRAAGAPHRFLSVTKQGLSAIVETTGNDLCHIILRGGISPNYDSMHVRDCGDMLKKAHILPKIMIDASHGNSQKQHQRQIAVIQDIVNQLSTATSEALVSSGDYIVGVMIESNLVAGRQNLTQKSELIYGQSITGLLLIIL